MLTIKIFSFSYKKSGIPHDPTINGGGFVFDCRFIYNHGRKEEFKHLTGKDIEVIEFLNSNLEMQKFLTLSSEMVESAIDNYLSRDFRDLMICFGCTGGQHRSVYAAEKLAEILKKSYGSRTVIEIHHNDFPPAYW